ncbi:hypothetical protein EMGBD2_03860 [Nitrospirota bacterium]|nr:hypothetical protein EMGBD2_03860 [Nitrospirota bacterium]GDX88317.1 hypothetical protein LBMAG45_01730 [Nitrospirota bacterium]
MKNEFTEIETKEAFKSKFSKAYINDSNGNLIIGWDRQSHNLIWLLLFAPFFYFRKGVITWGSISLLCYFYFLNALSQPLCRQGTDCDSAGITISVLVYLFSVLKPVKKVLKAGYEKTKKEKPIFNGEFLIFTNTEVKNDIQANGIEFVLDKQARSIAEKKEAEKLTKEKEIKEKFRIEQEKIIEDLNQKYLKSIKEKKQSYNFINGTGFDSYPSRVIFNWKISNQFIHHIIDKALHASDIKKLEDLREDHLGLLGIIDKEIEVLEDRNTISLLLDRTEISVDDISSIEAKTEKRITRHRQETQEIISKGVSVDNVTSIGNSPIGISSTRSEIVTKVKEEEGFFVHQLKIRLKDAREMEIKEEYFYTGDSSKTLEEFESFYRILIKNIN